MPNADFQSKIANQQSKILRVLVALWQNENRDFLVFILDGQTWA
jgi:hypothetical protein